MKLNYKLLDQKFILKIIALLLKFFVFNFNWMRVLLNTNISCFVSRIFNRLAVLPITMSLCLILMLGVGNVLGQQVIGSFPNQDGGFDGTTPGTLGTTLSSSVWTRQSQASTTASVTAIGGRSSSPYATVNSNSSNATRVLQSPQQAATSASTAYRIQFYYKSSANASNFQSGVSTNGTTNPTYTTAATLNSTSGVWTKYESTVTTPSNTVSTNGIGIVRFSATGGNVNVDIDDFVIYAGSSADNTAPNSPGAVTVSNPTTSSLDISWGAASGGVDGGGYVIVRYSSNPNADNDPNQNGIYAVGNTTTNGTGSLTGTIRYIGTGTSFTDNAGLSSGTQYWYKVYTVDKAFNYSAESSGNGITSNGCSAPSTLASSFSATSISSSGMTINWLRGNGDAGVIVLAKSGSAVNADPASGSSYIADAAFMGGSQIGTGNYVVYQGTGTSVNVTGLNPNTTYHFAIYEYNSSGTCYNVTELTGNAATLCNTPATQASNGNASSVTTTNATISFTTGSGDSRLVIVKASSSITGAPIDGTSYTANTNFSSATVGAGFNTGEKTVYSSTGTSVNITNLTANTTYYVNIYEFNNSTKCYNSLFSNSFSFSTTSNLSDVISEGGSSVNISSLINDVAPLTSGTGLQVWQFTIRDGGAAGDADALPTIVSSITFTQGSGNQINTWNDAIQSIALFDGTTNISTGTVISNQVQFSGLNINITDNGTKTLTVRMSVKCPIGNASSNLDGDDFVFQISNSNISTSGASSSFSSFSTISSGNGNNVLSVVATDLAFMQQPTNTGVSLEMSPSVVVAAVDACGNIDLGYAGTITINSSGIMTGTSISISAVSGVATFPSIIHTSVGVGYNLSSSSSGLASSISTNFDIIPITFFKPGEVAILGFNVDVDGSGTDEISFVNFVDFTSGTTLDITDNPYEKCGTTDGWGISEGWVRLKRINSTLPAGRVVTLRITNGNGTVISPNDGNWVISNPAPAGQGTFNLNSNGEQIFLLQGGTVNGPGAITATSDEGRYTPLNILFGFNTKGNIWTPVCGNSSAGGTQNSAKPRFLDCFMVWPSTTADFNKYKGPISATSVRLWIERINDPSNWQNYVDNTNYVANTGGGYDYVNYNGSFLGMDITITSGAFDAGKWVGSTNTDWFECSNWQNLKVPDSTTNVNIDNVTNDPIIGAINSNFPNGAFCNDLTLTNTNGAASLNLNNATSILTIKGNVTNDGSITATNGSLQFRSSNTQTYSGTGSSNLFDIWLNNTHSNSLTLNQDITYSNNFYFSNGILTINPSNKLISTKTTVPSIFNYNTSKFINGKFRQYITPNTSSYPLPLGYNNSSTDYHPANFLNGNVTGINYIDASVNSIIESGSNTEANLNSTTASQQTAVIEDIIHFAEWNIKPDTNISSGNYGVDLFVSNMGMTDFDDNKFVVVKRDDNSTTYADWNTFEATTFIPTLDDPGRVYSSGNGFARRTNFTTFSKFAIGRLNNSVLPITVYDFKVNRISKSKNLIEWKSNDEENLMHYELEKSEDGFNYQVFNYTLPLEQNNSIEKHYFVVDSSIIRAANYYKLFSLDNNGKRLYHDIAFINELKSNEDFSILYSSEGVTVLIDEEGVYTDALIYSSMGQLIKKLNIETFKTKNIQLNNSEFASGIYFIQLIGKNKNSTSKLILGK